MIGFIGLGIMGSRMAANLQKAGHSLIVYNRSKEKAEELLQNGAKWADSPIELVKQTDLVITMLSTPEVMEEVATGKDGFLDHMRKNALWMDSSTVDPMFSRRMANEAKKRGIRFVDAPVAGSLVPALKGELVFLVGGDKEDFEQVKPLCEIMGKKVSHMGGNGGGASMKLVINMVLGQAMAAFSEAVVFGESMGLTKEVIFDNLVGGPAVAPLMNSKKDKIAADDFSAEFPLKWLQKDLQLVCDMAYAHGASLPVANATKEVYALAKRYGHADEDISALYAFLSHME